MIQGLLRGLGLIPIKNVISPQGPNKELADRVYNLMQGLQKGMHISPSQIEELLGEDAVEPLIITDASYFGQQRKMGTQQITHFLEILLRPLYFNFEFKNDDKRLKTVIPFHDLGEDLGNSAAGAYAITRLIGDRFGANYKEFINALTDFRTIIYKQMESRVPETYLASGGFGKNPGKDELVDIISKLQAEALNPESQSNPYSRLLSNYNDYLKVLKDVKWPDKDKKRAEEIVQDMVHITGKISEALAPKDEISRYTNRFFEDMIRDVRDKANESYHDGCFFPSVDDTILTNQKCPSPLLHNLEHAKYWHYVRNLTDYAISMTTEKDDNGIILFRAKSQDRGDNLRTSFETRSFEYHMVYRKTLDLCLQFDRYLAHVEKSRPKDYESAYRHLRFLKAEFLGRMIEDLGQILHKRDTAYNNHKDWMESEFRSVLEYVGADIEAYTVDNLKQLVSLDIGSFRKNHIYVLQTYATLKEDRKLLIYADKMARRSAKSIFTL